MAPPSGELSSAARLRGPSPEKFVIAASLASPERRGGPSRQRWWKGPTCIGHSLPGRSGRLHPPPAAPAFALAKYDVAWLANCPEKSDISVIQMKNPQLSLGAFIWIRQRPTLPGRLQPSTIGAERLNFCVRDGNRWIPFAIVTGMPLRVCAVRLPLGLRCVSL